MKRDTRVVAGKLPPILRLSDDGDNVDDGDDDVDDDLLPVNDDNLFTFRFPRFEHQQQRQQQWRYCAFKVN